MAEPLVIQFAADTSRAQSAMANLAAQIVGNMTQIGVAMTGGAANANGFGAALEGMKANATRAAAAVGADVASIVAATANAAAAEKATLENVTRAFVGAAAASNTAGAATRAGLATTTGAVTGVVAQIPSLKTLLGAFVAFEAVKLVFESVSASIEAAGQHVEAFTRLARDADRLGVGTTFFQRTTLDAKGLGLEARQVVAALERAREAATPRLGEGEHGSNASAIDGRLAQHVKAGNLTPADKAGFDAAPTQEARLRAMLDLIDRLREAGRNLAAFDLAGHFFGPEVEQRLREGVDLTRRLRENLDCDGATAGGKRIVAPEEIERAQQLDAKLRAIRDTFATALIPIERDASHAALDLYGHLLDAELVLGRAAIVASRLYEELAKVPGAIDAALPSAGRLATLLGAVDLGKSLGLDGIGPRLKTALADLANAAGAGDLLGLPRAGETPDQAEARRSLDAARDRLREGLKRPGAVSDAVEASAKLDFRPRPSADRSSALPSRHPREAADGASDPVETFIHGLAAGPASRDAPRPIAVQVAVTTPDAPSFLRAESQVTAALARAVQRGTRGL